MLRISKACFIDLWLDPAVDALLYDHIFADYGDDYAAVTSYDMPVALDVVARMRTIVIVEAILAATWVNSIA